jgi:hypothetical protein
MNHEVNDIYDELTSVNWSSQEAESVNGLIRYDELPSYETFIRQCLLPNRPAIFTAKCGLMKHWPCVTDWLDEDRIKPNFDRLSTLYGSMNVPVTKCSPSTNEYASDDSKMSMRFEEFIDLWRTNDTTAYYYCKDWHLQQMLDRSEKPTFYSVPSYFQSDWLNETCLADNQDDFRFVYMGGHGTNTPLHMDVLGTYSWSPSLIHSSLHKSQAISSLFRPNGIIM